MNSIKKSLLLLTIGGLLMMCGCGKGITEHGIIKTSLGDMEIELYGNEAPKAVENFVTHAKEGYYDNLIFHRVINGFMAQGGDPTATGMGGESIWGKPFEDEFSKKLINDYGALSMANAGPNTNGSQFFIVQSRDGAPWLNGVHTVFGHLTSGYDVLDKITNQPVDRNSKPLEDIVIKTIEIK